MIRSFFKKSLVFGILSLFAVLLSACNDNNGDSGLLEGPNSSTIVELIVTPKETTVPIGLSRQFTVEAVMSDSSVIDVSSYQSLSWSSSDSLIATVNTDGLAIGVTAGNVVITASLMLDDNSTVSDSADLEVTTATVVNLDVIPLDPQIPVGLTQEFYAEVALSDGTVLDVTNEPALNWSSDDESVAVINPDRIESRTLEEEEEGELATAKSEGEANIIASGVANGVTFTDSSNLTVIDVVGETLQVTPQDDSVPVGLTKQFKATLLMSDGESAFDVTDDPMITWYVNEDIATISDTGLVTALETGDVIITAQGSANGEQFSASATLTITDAVVTDLQVTPKVQEVAAGQTQQFVATALFSDGTTEMVTDDVNWISSVTDVATVMSSGVDKGLATSYEAGETVITANGLFNEQEFSDEATLTVTDAIMTALDISPNSASIANGLTQQFTAIATYSDYSTVDMTTSEQLSWTSSDSDVAIIISIGTDNKGLATGKSVGSTTITATVGEFVDTASLEVTDAIIESIVVTPKNASVPVGLTKEFIATAYLSDGTTEDVTDDASLSWVTSDVTTATISNSGEDKGVATGEEVGEATIQATIDGYSDTAVLTVTDAIVTELVVTPQNSSVAVGLTQQYKAEAIFSNSTTEDVTNDPGLSWSSSEPDIATISTSGDDMGLATGIIEGVVTITANGNIDGTSVEGTTTLTVTSAVVVDLQVTPASASIAKGLTQQYKAEAIFSDGDVADVTNDVSWSSSDGTIATIDNTGLATGADIGLVTITASDIVNDPSVVGDAELSVTPAVVIDLVISPRETSVAKGLTIDFSAVVILSDGSTEDVTDDSTLSWTSSETNLATIDTDGIATGIDIGTTTITATGQENGETISDSTTLEVTPAVMIDFQVIPSNASIADGFTQPFITQAVMSDDSVVLITDNETLSWISSDTDVATIMSITDDTGLAIAQSEGTTDITASISVDSVDYSDIAVLEVTEEVVDSLQVTPQIVDIPVGLTVQYKAEALMSNGTIIDVTDDMTWTSSDSDIATIISTEPNQGLATGVDIGEVTITASGNINGVAISSNAQLTVTSAIVESLSVMPEMVEFPVGVEQAFTAMAILTDGSSLDVTNEVTLSWTSDDPDVVSVGNTVDVDKGIAVGLMAGETATITAFGTTSSGQDFSAEAQFNVVEAEAEELVVTTERMGALIAGFDQQFTANLIMSDGSRVDMTKDSALSWSSSNTDIVTIDNVIEPRLSLQKGDVTALQAGSATITVFGDINGDKLSTDLEIEVIDSDISEWVITPSSSVISVGDTVQLTLMAIMLDGSSIDITSDGIVGWSSKDTDVATVSGTGNEKGLVTGVNSGTTEITVLVKHNGSLLVESIDVIVE